MHWASGCSASAAGPPTTPHRRATYELFLRGHIQRLGTEGAARVIEECSIRARYAPAYASSRPHARTLLRRRHGGRRMTIVRALAEGWRSIRRAPAPFFSPNCFHFE
jgi:hypothetical protein